MENEGDPLADFNTMAALIDATTELVNAARELAEADGEHFELNAALRDYDEAKRRYATQYAHNRRRRLDGRKPPVIDCD